MPLRLFLRGAIGLLAGSLLCMSAPSILAQTSETLATPAQGVAALSPFIDVHAHMDHIDSERSVQAAMDAMKGENAAKIIFLPSPWTPEDKDRFDFEFFETPVKKHPDRLAFLGGGGSLNIMILQAVRSGDAGSEVKRKFRERAEEILRQGAIGFGEITSEHLPSAASPSYQTAPPDHPLLLLLADIAAQHNVPIDLHMEAIPETMPLPAGSSPRPILRSCRATLPALNGSYCTILVPRSFGPMRNHRQHGISHSRPLPAAARGACQSLYGDQSGSAQPRKESSHGVWQDQAGVAEAFPGFPRQVRDWKRSILPAGRVWPAAVAGGCTVIQSASWGFTTQDRHRECAAHLLR